MIIKHENTSINFREPNLFNLDVRKTLGDIKVLCHTGTLCELSPETKQPLLKPLLKQLSDQLFDYFEASNHENPSIRSNEVVSEFLQNLIYYLMHAVKDQQLVTDEKINEMASLLIDQDLFFYKYGIDTVTLWIDPQEEYTALHVATRNGMLEITQKLIEKAEKELDPERFKKFFTHKDKDGFSALNSACIRGYTEIVKLLFGLAVRVLLNYEDLKAFITGGNNDGFSALNSACTGGHIDSVKLLFALAAWLNPEDFKNFLFHKNNNGTSSFKSACQEGHEEVVAYLLEQVAMFFEYYPQDYKDFLEQKNKEGYTPLNSTCMVLKEKYSENNKSDLRKFVAVIKLLIQCGADPKIKNKKGFSAIMNLPRPYENLVDKHSKPFTYKNGHVVFDNTKSSQTSATQNNTKITGPGN